MSAEAMYYYCMEREGLGTEVERANSWHQIEQAYLSPGRFYHNLYHVNHVITRIGELLASRALDSNINALWLAAVYHDVVYVPGSDFNELGSAAFAALDINGENGSPHSITREIMQLIRATTHEEYTEDVDTATAILLDADLYELSTDRYQENSANIRKEFNCTDNEWRKGRTKWLTDFLARPHIYLLTGETSADGRDRNELDKDARANMVNEVKELGLDLAQTV